MPATEMLSISLPLPVIEGTQDLARRENKTLDEVVLDALQRYQLDKSWEDFAEYGRASADAVEVRIEEDVLRVIHEYRREKRETAK